MKNLTIEIYRGGTKLQTLKADRKGKFTVSVESPSDYTDTVSIVLYSKKYDSKKITRIPLYKKTITLATSLTRKNSKKKKEKYVDDTFTGRLLD